MDPDDVMIVSEEDIPGNDEQQHADQGLLRTGGYRGVWVE
jgi:hypothetical protein